VVYSCAGKEAVRPKGSPEGLKDLGTLSQRFGDRIQAISGGKIECLTELEDGEEEI
jgi:hypothetical protein